MADLLSLNRKSITQMSYDEGLEWILSIRSKRHQYPIKTTKPKKPKTTKVKSPTDVSPEQAERLLLLLTKKMEE